MRHSTQPVSLFQVAAPHKDYCARHGHSLSYLSGIVDAMELRHLRYFVAVAEEANISQAARRLNLSQPPLSRQIRDLEEELGVPLLKRSGNRLALTEAGRIFRLEAESVLQRVETAVSFTRAVGETKKPSYSRRAIRRLPH